MNISFLTFFIIKYGIIKNIRGELNMKNKNLSMGNFDMFKFDIGYDDFKVTERRRKILH